jgi:hypothetical protein
MRNALMVVYEEANEIGEPPIRHTLDIQEELDITPLDLREGLNVDLAGPDGERLYFKIEVRGAGRVLSPPSAWFEEKRKLLDREDPFVVVPPNSLRGHAI